MDRNTLRNLLLSDDFKPKELVEFATPYLVSKSGVSLDGQFKLVGLNGKESVDIRDKAKVQVGIDKDGNPILEYDSAKLAGLAIIKCLYSREDGQPIFDQAMPQLSDPADLAGILGMDEDAFNKLGVDVLNFAGLGKGSAAQAKNASSPTTSDSSPSISQENSAGSDPLQNSSDASQPTN